MGIYPYRHALPLAEIEAGIRHATNNTGRSYPMNGAIRRIIQPFPFNLGIGRVLAHNKRKHPGYPPAAFHHITVGGLYIRNNQFTGRIAVNPLVQITGFAHRFPRHFIHRHHCIQVRKQGSAKGKFVAGHPLHFDFCKYTMAF